MFEPETDVQTRYEIYQQINSAREIVMSSESGTRIKELGWQRIDWLLDSLLELDSIEVM